ncbi:MAG: RDD family protein [Cyclobacteriaceae bacterium]
MEQILDQPLIQTNVNSVKYGAFWPRLGALIVDGLVLAPVTFGINYLNITSWKSPIIYILVALLSVTYKPVMEYVYGATLGKMVLKLKVVNLKFEKATFSEILFRNVFHIVPSVVTMFLSITIYQNPEFASVSGYSEYSIFISEMKALQIINLATGLIIIADAIVLLADKYNRAWHDKIGGTFVIEKLPGA